MVLKISNFMKIRLVGFEMLHADRQTDVRKDMTKLRVAFRNFANASEMLTLVLQRTSPVQD
jgi:hypothetical protein